MTSKDEQESASATALQRPLILEKIFTFLPTNFLLSTCSLVNNFWNAEARTFIRNNRKCTPYSPVAGAWHDSCRCFTEFAQLCEQILEKGRVNPWNSFRTATGHYCSISNERSTGGFECPVHRPISALLQSNGSSLLSLDIKGMPKLSPNGLTGWRPRFPRLKEVKISNVYGAELDLPAQREFVRTMLEKAPNLKRIVTDSLWAVNVVPEEKYGLLTHLDFFIGDMEDQTRLLRKIVERQPALEELRIVAPHPSLYRNEDNDGGERHAHYIHVVNDLRRRCVCMLEQLLNGCHGSVKNIAVDGVYPLGQMSFPPLVRLAELRITSCCQSSTTGLWNSIATIDDSVRMPQLRLREVSIQVGMIEPGEEDYIEWKGVYLDWPDMDTDLLQNSSNSVRKLSLDLECGSFNLSTLQAVFPNVTALNITMNRTGVAQADVPPVTEIWELWPDLEELRMSGEKNFLGRNFDADFCGISEEEAEFLRGKDVEYLRAVHIVPIKPCPLTMSRLRLLQICLTFDLQNRIHRSFISIVTELVMLERMEGRDVSVEWNFDDDHIYDNVYYEGFDEFY